MKKRIEKVAVLGAGTMGARIAAHVANAGIPCFLLDIVPAELNADEKRKGLTLESPAVRNRIVLAGLDTAKKSRPAAFFTAETARLVTPGNLEDNLGWCAQADWIIEAVAENLEIKRKLFERVEGVRKPGAIVTSNTSGLPNSFDLRRTVGRFPTTLGWNAFLQSSALHEAGGIDSRAKDVAGCAGDAR